MKTRILALLTITIAAIAMLSVVGIGNSNVMTQGDGAVYTINNASKGNYVMRFDREPDGTLMWTGNFSTHGLGTGTGLGSQGAVVLTADNAWLLVVDAGSNEISVFQVKGESLVFTDKASSWGTMPISITIYKNWVYVLNAGGLGNIAGFMLSATGMLTHIVGSNKPLSGMASPSPEQIGFKPDGKVIVVTEKATNIIDTYTVNALGVASGPTTHDSNSPGPYGFAFDHKGTLILSEAATGTLSSYNVSDSGHLRTLSGSMPDFGLAPCWVAVTENGKFAYTSNAHGGTISMYRIRSTGFITLFSSIAAKANIPTLELALSTHSMYLYALNGNAITGFKVYPDGSLDWVTTVTGVPAAATGLAAI